MPTSDAPAPKPYEITLRDRFAYKTANWILKTFASKYYEAFITVCVLKGLEQIEKELGIVRQTDGTLTATSTTP